MCIYSSLCKLEQFIVQVKKKLYHDRIRFTSLQNFIGFYFKIVMSHALNPEPTTNEDPMKEEFPDHHSSGPHERIDSLPLGHIIRCKSYSLFASMATWATDVKVVVVCLLP